MNDKMDDKIKVSLHYHLSPPLITILPFLVGKIAIPPAFSRVILNSPRFDGIEQVIHKW